MHDEKTTADAAEVAEGDATDHEMHQPDAADLVQALEERLGPDGLKALVVACLKGSDRGRAIQVINAAVGNVRLSASTDRGRMSRLIMEGLARRREAVLDAIQTLARDPFEWKAKQAVQERMDEAVDALNKAREDTESTDEGPTKEASARVVAVLQEVLDVDEARRLILLNAFPDVVDHMLAALSD